jgi:hypothetical protein
MTVTQSIPNTRLTGTQTFTFQNTAQPWTNCLITIDRTVTGGLNSLTPTDTLDISIDYSPDGGTNWVNVSAQKLVGGSFVVKGVTVPTESDLAIGIGQPFPVGTAFRLNTTASTPVRIAGTVVYS